MVGYAIPPRAVRRSMVMTALSIRARGVYSGRLLHIRDLMIQDHSGNTGLPVGWSDVHAVGFLGRGYARARLSMVIIPVGREKMFYLRTHEAMQLDGFDSPLAG